ncbi:hypothetical protein LINPERHAP2_LOCUS19087 [Linum perenne]
MFLVETTTKLLLSLDVCDIRESPCLARSMLEKFGGRRRKEREWLKQERKRKKKKEKRNKNKNKQNDKGSKDGSSLPRFGEWDESDPSSAEGYSAVFDLVRKEKKSDVGNMSFKLIDSINTRRRRNRIQMVDLLVKVCTRKSFQEFGCSFMAWAPKIEGSLNFAVNNKKVLLIERLKWKFCELIFLRSKLDSAWRHPLIHAL